VGVSEAGDRHFRAALNQILAEGRAVF
jgi:hypothetical protein